MPQELFKAERLSFVTDDFKFTFLKPYGAKMKDHVLVIRQHLHTDEVKTEYYSYAEIQHNFYHHAGTILSDMNKPKLTYKPDNNFRF